MKSSENPAVIENELGAAFGLDNMEQVSNYGEATNENMTWICRQRSKLGLKVYHVPPADNC